MSIQYMVIGWCSAGVFYSFMLNHSDLAKLLHVIAFIISVLSLIFFKV